MKSDTSQGALGNRWLRGLGSDAFQAMLPFLSLREVFPRVRGHRSEFIKLTEHVVFPIDCQVALIDCCSYEELSWAGEPEGLLTSAYLADVAATELVARTRGHAYVLPHVVVNSRPYLRGLIAAERCPVVERALAWQLARAKRSIRQNVAAYLLTFNGWAFSLTQQEIATALGHRRESVTEVMKGFERAGYVEHSRAYIDILNRPALVAVRDGEDELRIQPAAEVVTPTANSTEEASNGNS